MISKHEQNINYWQVPSQASSRNVKADKLVSGTCYRKTSEP